MWKRDRLEKSALYTRIADYATILLGDFILISNAHLAFPYTAFRSPNQCAAALLLADNKLGRVQDTEEMLKAPGQIIKATDGKQTREEAALE